MDSERLVVEVGTMTGWVHDIAVCLGIEVQVANPNTEGWRWKRVKRKTDRDDALKPAWLSVLNQWPTIWMSLRRVRQWRALINYRHELVGRRTAIRNSIRSLLDMQGYRMAMGARAWTEAGIAVPRSLARPAAEFVQRVHRQARDEILAREVFDTRLEAKVRIERWRKAYNTVRRHSSLGYRPLAPEARRLCPLASAKHQQADRGDALAGQP